ncbi:MAG: glycosyltransferase family 4 protein [Alphaproteobacteria bacterium]|nr:glycosyltransferase family 4 protein [Alphaproteobacteria bacterium]
MHILVANNVYPPIVAGGAELIVAYLCEELARRKHRVTVVSTCAPDMEPYPVETRNGVEVIRFFPSNVYWSFNRVGEPRLKKLIWHVRDAWNTESSRRLHAVMESGRPDLLHTHVIDGMSASIWGRAHRAGIPVIHTAHDYHLLCPRAFLLSKQWQICSRPTIPCRLYRNWHLGTTRYVDLFVSPSRFLLDLHKQAGIRPLNSAVVHNGIPLPDNIVQLNDHHAAGTRTRFILLTRLTVEKGVRVALAAMAQVPRRLGIELTIAGKGPLEEEVRAAAARDPRIRFIGFIEGEEKYRALTQAGYLLLPSLWYENAPVAIIEAAAYGLGVIGSAIGGIPEFIEPNRTGLLFPPGDAESLANIMIRLARSPTMLPALADHARALAKRFTVGRMTDAYERHYVALRSGGTAFAAAS